MNYDLIVVGAGHAGVESALIAAKMNKKILVITGNKSRIAAMPCNPSIGGPAKGIIVREIDALGGEMAKAADNTALQIKLLNSSRGPAVWALRAQSDKIEYSKYFQEKISNTKNIDLVIGMVKKLIIKDNVCFGVETESKNYFAKKVIITTGTYMESQVLEGEDKKSEGPDGDAPSFGISKQLRELNVKTIRLKTGTPPRVLKSSIDFSQAKVEPGTDSKLAFSYSTNKFIPFKDQEVCWLIHSNSSTHNIVRDSLKKSPMYSGEKVGNGPRYCPSFEDKIVRFADKDRHQIFLEPESKQLDTIYLQGFSTSMPFPIQEKMVQSLPGLEKAKIIKYAYAIEYDAINPIQLRHTLEFKNIKNLYSAGQVNGTSGYEEAACQGLMSAINACLSIDNKEPLILKRNEAYIGILIDDLVTKGTSEPYRMLTSRAEFRLLLRNDNAEKRLKHYSKTLGTINSEEWNDYQANLELEEKTIKWLKTTRVTPKSELSKFLNNKTTITVKEGTSLLDLIKRPEFKIEYINMFYDFLKDIKITILQSILISQRFEGYIKKEEEQVNKTYKLENTKIPADLDFNLVENISLEAKEKLIKIQPITIGQASRISGVNLSDVQMILFHLKNRKNSNGN